MTDLLIGESSVMMLRSDLGHRNEHASFGSAVTHVVSIRPQEQVVRTNALSVVTVVADEQPVSYRAVVNSPGYTVSEVHSSADSEYAIPMLIESANPFPAAIAREFVDLFPEAVSNRTSAGLGLPHTFASAGAETSAPHLYGIPSGDELNIANDAGAGTLREHLDSLGRAVTLPVVDATREHFDAQFYHEEADDGG